MSSKLSKHSHDRLCSLPDHLLIHILSFLPIEDVVRTTLISKRWDHLWVSVPNLHFQSSELKEPKKFINFVNQVLLLHKFPKIHKFSLSMNFESTYDLDMRSYYEYVAKLEQFTSDMYSWFHFAYWSKVEQLSLGFYKNPFLFTFPDFFFKSDFLVKIELTYVHLPKIPDFVSWVSLKSLSLCQCFLNDERMRTILSGCPLLEKLEILRCGSLMNLDLSSNSSVKSLKLEIDQANFRLIAPKLKSLYLSAHINSLRGSYSFSDLSYLEIVELDFNSFNGDCQSNFKCIGASYLNKFKYIIDGLRHAKVFSLSLQTMQILSAFAIKLSSLKCKHLTVMTTLQQWDMSGLACLLTNSPELESLCIKSCRESKNGCDEECYDISFQCVMHQLKTVELHSFISSESTITTTTIGDFCKEVAKETELAKFLLKNAPGLQVMTIYLGQKQSFEETVITDIVSQKFRTLLKLPMASSCIKLSMLP